MKPINLIPHSRTLARRLRRRLTRWAAANVAALAALALAALALHLTPPTTSDSTQRLALTRDANQLQTRQLHQLQLDFTRHQRRLHIHHHFNAQPDFSILLHDLARHLNPHHTTHHLITLTRLELTPILTDSFAPSSTGASRSPHNPTPTTTPTTPTLAAYRLDIAGLGRTLQDVNAFILRLEQAWGPRDEHPLIERLDLIASQRDIRRGQPAIAFTLRATLTGRQHP